MTTESPEILIVTTAVDEASDAVALELQRAGAPFLRLNTEDFPVESRSSFRSDDNGVSASWSSDGGIYPFDRIRRVWFRRHRLPALPPDTEPAHAEYTLRESQWFVRGLMFSLAEVIPRTDWMSHPLAIERAESKILQLRAAGSLGLVCPPTLISNDPMEIREFFRANNGSIVAKALRSGYFDYGEHQTAAFTTALAEADLANDLALSAAPVIYQRHLPKSADVRVTVVGEEVFAAAIHSQAHPSAMTDWRQTSEDLVHAPIALPPTVRTACLSLVRHLGLAFGAIDLVLTPQQEFYFLEINPSGQWLWIEDRLGYPISNRIAAWLMREQES